MRKPEDSEVRNDHFECRGIILKGDKVLVMFRRKKGQEYFVFPGGHMRYGEEPLDTAIREIREETTIEVENLRPAFDYINHMKVERRTYYFVGDWKTGEPILSGEESRESSEDNYYEPMWVDISDIPSLVLYPTVSKEWVINWLDRFLKES